MVFCNSYGMVFCNSYGMVFCNSYGMAYCNSYGMVYSNIYGMVYCNSYGIVFCNSYGAHMPSTHPPVTGIGQRSPREKTRGARLFGFLNDEKWAGLLLPRQRPGPGPAPPTFSRPRQTGLPIILRLCIFEAILPAPGPVCHNALNVVAQWRRWPSESLHSRPPPVSISQPCSLFPRVTALFGVTV
jgi:hypothetical protein